jgi:hypothetical protein
MMQVKKPVAQKCISSDQVIRAGISKQHKEGQTAIKQKFGLASSPFASIRLHQGYLLRLPHKQ